MSAFGVWCEPYWSARFGTRAPAWLKAVDGSDESYPTLEAATARADALNASAYGQHASYSAKAKA